MIHLCVNEYLSPTEEFKGQSLNEKQYSENNSHHLQQTSIIQKEKETGKALCQGVEIQRRKNVSSPPSYYIRDRQDKINTKEHSLHFLSIF